MAKLASSTLAVILFVAVCYYSIPGTTFAQTTTGNCMNAVNQSVIKKFVKVCAVLSDIQSLIDKEDKIANTSATNDQRLSLEAAVAVSKGVRQNMCNWMNHLVGGNYNESYCSIEKMNELCTGMA